MNRILVHREAVSLTAWGLSSLKTVDKYLWEIYPFVCFLNAWTYFKFTYF